MQAVVHHSKEGTKERNRPKGWREERHTKLKQFF